MATPNVSRRISSRTGYRHHGYGFAQSFADIIKFELDTALVDYLVSQCVLTIEDADRIRGASGQTNRNKLLLNILKDRPYDTFRFFIEAFQETQPKDNDVVTKMKCFQNKDQQDIVQFADMQMEIDDVCVRFQKSYRKLVNRISSPVDIADILLELETFNNEDNEDVTSNSTVFQQNRKLLSKIHGKGRSGYDQFLIALRKSSDPLDQELAGEIENTEINLDNKILLHIGYTVSYENENIESNARGFGNEIKDDWIEEDRWLEEDSVFIETKRSMKVYSAIKEKDFVTIVGSSGSGKTSLMRHVVLKLKYEEGFQIVHVDSPENIANKVGYAKQIFLIDDVLGTYAVNPFRKQIWEKFDEQIQQCLTKRKGRMKILFTSRKQVANNEEFKTCSSIITQSENIVDLEDDQIALSNEEKRQILTKHLQINDLQESITEDDLEEACKSNYAFPLLCRMVSSDRERLNNISTFFREPFSVLKEELRHLGAKNKVVYCSLVLCMLFNGKIKTDLFDINLPRHEKINLVTEACGLDTNISRQKLEEGLKTVVGTYVNYENGMFAFIHDALLESVSCDFAKMNPSIMFSCCDIDLIRDRVRVNSKLPDDDENVIVVNKDQFDYIAKRVLTECEDGRFSNVLLSQFIKEEDFVEHFGTLLKKEKRITISMLMNTSSSERQIRRQPCCNFAKYLLGVFCCVMCKTYTSKSTRDNKKNKIDESNAALKQVIHMPSRHSTLMHWILATGCYRLFRYFWENSSKKEQQRLLSKDWGFAFTKPFFPLAVLGGNIDIIRTLHSYEADVNCFSYFGETPLSIAAMSGRDDIASDLIDWGADVNQADMASHRFPSSICVGNENTDVLMLLLNNNCDVNVVDIHGVASTLPLALMMRKRNIVKLLLEFDSTNHPLHKAILNCEVDFFKTNVKTNDINSQTRNGLTPLHYATQVDDKYMIASLLGLMAYDEKIHEPGSSQEEPFLNPTVANVDLKSKDGLTPLHFAVLADHVEAVEMLFHRNADVNAKDQFGRVPLHYSQVSAISSLLLDREKAKFIVTRPVQRCSIVPGNDSDDVILEIVEEDHGRQLSWRTVLRNVAWYILPFKTWIYQEMINQPDKQGNTPLHFAAQTSFYLNPDSKEKNYSTGNVKHLLKRGANMHLRNNSGFLPNDFIFEQVDLQGLFTSFSKGINQNREIPIRKMLLIISAIFCFALIFSPIAFSDNRNEFPDRYYYLLIGVIFSIMNDVIIIRVMMKLWQMSLS